MLEISSLPVLASDVFNWHQCIRDHFAALDRRAITLAHIRNQWESPNVLIECLIHTRPAAGGESPHDILAIVHIDVIADKHESVNGVSSFLVEDEVANLLAEFSAVGLHAAELGGVHAQSYPRDLGFEGCEGVGDREIMLLADFADFCGGEGADESVLFCQLSFIFLKESGILTVSSVNRPQDDIGRIGLLR